VLLNCTSNQTGELGSHNYEDLLENSWCDWIHGERVLCTEIASYSLVRHDINVSTRQSLHESSQVCQWDGPTRPRNLRYNKNWLLLSIREWYFHVSVAGHFSHILQNVAIHFTLTKSHCSKMTHHKKTYKLSNLAFVFFCIMFNLWKRLQNAAKIILSSRCIQNYLG
jgi:hypothetical protein